MPFVFECPHCHVKSEVDDAFAGQTGPCFACGREIQLPHSPPSTYTAASTLLQTKKRSLFSARLAYTLVATGLVACLVGLTWFIVFRVIVPNYGDNSPRAQLEQSRRNLTIIAQAMRAYEAEKGSLPPAYVADEQGRPAHSWRVLLLPYLGHQQLFDEYRFDEPWDGPHNATLSGRMPAIYASPADPSSLGFSDTSYQVVVGPTTAFPGAVGLPSSQIQDGASVTLLVTEVFQSNTNWLKPADLSQRQMQYTVNAQQGTGISSGHRGGALVLTADGKTHFLKEDNRPEVIEALVTASGNERLSWTDLSTSDP